MARVIYVKHARQRYEMVPVLDENGQPKRTPVMKSGRRYNEETGLYETTSTPKTDKRGREVTMAVTVQDRSRPLPNLKCDYPGCTIDGGEILPRTSYKHITPRSGPFGSQQRSRHAEHPNWDVWEYSSSRSAQVARTVSEIHSLIDDFVFSSPDDFDDLKQQCADMASEQRDEQEEALNNMPEQLQDGSQAQEYFEALEAWVDEIDQADAPDDSDALMDCEDCDGESTVECETCGGSGKDETDDPDEDGEYPDCADCEGTGTIDCDQCDGGKTPETVSDDWAEEAKQALRDAVDSVEI